MKKALVALLVATASPAAFAWGPLGHRVVAETAALIVQDDLPETWGPLFARHRFELGVYAFLPDASFRHNDGARGKVEAPTHYLHLDAPAGGTAPDGTVDRRVAQFLQLARDQVKEGGRIGCLFMEAALGICRIGYKHGGTINWRYAFNASAPVMPGFARAREFTL